MKEGLQSPVLTNVLCFVICPGQAKIKAAQDQHNAALEQHDLACAALDGINTELLQVRQL
eukprot:1150286-Pelagomonas_calceolata.AAC.5